MQWFFRPSRADAFQFDPPHGFRAAETLLRVEDFQTGQTAFGVIIRRDAIGQMFGGDRGFAGSDAPRIHFGIIAGKLQAGSFALGQWAGICYYDDVTGHDLFAAAPAPGNSGSGRARNRICRRASRWRRGCVRAAWMNWRGNGIFSPPACRSAAPLRRTGFNRLFFTGRPGAGKTSLAQIIARQTRSKFERLSGVESNVADMRRVLGGAANRLENTGQSTILFIDEIHRFNKAQQDVLLPDVESGVVRLIGATTHNPFFFVNSPLVSRSQIFELQPLGEDDLLELLRRALADGERGLGHLKIRADDDALRHLARIADGDARKALNALEIAALTTLPQADGAIAMDLAVAEACIQKKAVVYDGDGDAHYDTISAFIKSMRGGDADAALYWLAKMIHAGEDPRFITRRILICAAEDVGLADPMALVLAVAAHTAARIHRLAGSAHPHRGGRRLYCHGQQKQQRLRGH